MGIITSFIQLQKLLYESADRDAEILREAKREIIIKIYSQEPLCKKKIH